MFALWDWISALVGLVGSKVNFVRLAGSFAPKYRSGICLLRAGWLSAALQECKIANEEKRRLMMVRLCVLVWLCGWMVDHEWPYPFDSYQSCR